MTALPFSRPLTRDDLEGLPEDDGHRYVLQVTAPWPMTFTPAGLLD